MGETVLDTATIEARLRAGLPDAQVVVEDPRGDGLFLIVHVWNAAFQGLTLLDQHRLVYKAIGEERLDPPPTLSLRTYVGEDPA